MLTLTFSFRLLPFTHCRKQVVHPKNKHISLIEKDNQISDVRVRMLAGVR